MQEGGSDADSYDEEGSVSEYGSDGGVLCRPWAAYAALVLAPILFLVAGAYLQTDREGVTFAQTQGWPLTEFPGVRDAWRDCRGLGRSAPWTDDMHVNFLLMTMDRVPFPDIWRDFLKGVPETSYKFYVHCKDYDACKANLEANGLNMIHIIQPVFNAWCVDLLSPMLQLLIVALGALPADRPAKFVIVSADHLPIKPFRTIQLELGKHPGASDICLYPPSFWHVARDDPSVLAPAASQWSVLSRRDAEVLLQRMPKPSATLPIVVPKLEGRAWNDFVVQHCIDEVSVFSTIFGLYHNNTIVNGSEMTTSEFPGIGPVFVNRSREQGCCRTWGFMGGGNSVEEVMQTVHWWGLVSPLASYVEKLQAAPDTKFYIPFTHCDTGCEVIFVVDSLGPIGQRILLESPFLFARKFAHNASMPGFAKTIFGA